MSDNRIFNRINVDTIGGKLIINVPNGSNNRRSVPIGIINVNAGGIGFKHHLVFPISRNNIFEIEFSLDDDEFNLKGIIKNKSLTDTNEIYYGVQFLETDEMTTQALVKSINSYEIRHFRASKDKAV